MVRVSLDISRLPHDVLTYADKQFYDFITSFCGQDASDLLSIQVIRSVDSFLTIQDIYFIFELESDDVKDIQKRCGFKRTNGTHTVRPGIRSTLDHLIRLLKEKQNKVGKMKKIQSASTQSSVSLSPSSSSSSSVTNNASNINTADTSFVSKKNELEHRAHIEKSIQEWCIKNEKLINIADFNLIFGVDYYLQISPSLYNAEIKCSCGVSNTLFLSSSGNFKLSNYFRHLKINCSLIETKVKNNSINNNTQGDSQNSSSISSFEQPSTSAARKRTQLTTNNNANTKKIRKV